MLKFVAFPSLLEFLGGDHDTKFYIFHSPISALPNTDILLCYDCENLWLFFKKKHKYNIC